MGDLRRCRRWNLSPLDERWEAIEECEKQFRDTRQRLSTENIALARLREGLELVRIGRPLRPEFAAWRYGRQFIKRRVSRVFKATAQAVGYMLTGLPLVLFFLTDENSRVIARVRDERGNRLPVVRKDLKELELVSGEGDEGWSLKVPYRPRETWGWIKRSKRTRSADDRTPGRFARHTRRRSHPSSHQLVWWYPRRCEERGRTDRARR